MTTATLTQQRTLESIARDRCRAANLDPDCLAARPSFSRKAETPAGYVVLQGATLSWRPLWTFFL